MATPEKCKNTAHSTHPKGSITSRHPWKLGMTRSSFPW